MNRQERLRHDPVKEAQARAIKARANANACVLGTEQRAEAERVAAYMEQYADMACVSAQEMAKHRERLAAGQTWNDLPDYLDRTPAKQACWQVGFTCTLLFVAGILALAWGVGGLEQLADILFR